MLFNTVLSRKSILNSTYSLLYIENVVVVVDEVHHPWCHYDDDMRTWMSPNVYDPMHEILVANKIPDFSLLAAIQGSSTWKVGTRKCWREDPKRRLSMKIGFIIGFISSQNWRHEWILIKKIVLLKTLCDCRQIGQCQFRGHFQTVDKLSTNHSLW